MKNLEIEAGKYVTIYNCEEPECDGFVACNNKLVDKYVARLECDHIKDIKTLHQLLSIP